MTNKLTSTQIPTWPPACAPTALDPAAIISTLAAAQKDDENSYPRPARVAILLAELRGLVFPVVGDAPVLDRLLLVLGVALTRSGDQAGIDDLARHGDVTGLPKRCIEALEQWPDGAGLREFLPEQPNRPGVGDAIRQSKSEKTHE